MPTEEKKAEYNENKKKKRRQDRFEAMPEAQALRAELSGLQRSMAGEGVYMESADEWSALRERAELWKEMYEDERDRKRSVEDMEARNLDFLIAQMKEMRDRNDESFQKGLAAGRAQEAVKTRRVEEELAQVRANFLKVCSIVGEASEELKEDNIFIDPNDSPSRSPKKKKKRKSKWGGDRVSAKWKAAHYGSSPARPTGIKQVV